VDKSLDPQLLPAAAIDVCRQLHQAGGNAYLVGGCVRDITLGHAPKDADIEVFGIDTDRLGGILAALGRVEHVGRKFGVFKLWYRQQEIDIALPRTEKKTARGHRGFDVTPDPAISPQIAALRRDFSINAMMYDPLEQKLFDFHDGLQDLETGTLRHVSPAFAEDPLRVLRGMQFAARFKLKLHPDTAALCRTLMDEASTLPASRIWGEWQKWCHAPCPSYGLEVLRQSGWIDLYPELEAMIDCPQDPKWHPEGDVWIHTGQVVDRAAEIARRYQWSGELRERLLLAAICHDMGKPVCTFSDENGMIRSPGHSQEGKADSERFLKKIAAPKRFHDYILPIVQEHMTHMHGEATPRAVRHLARRLEPASIELWEALVEADASGRHPSPPSRPALEWLEQAREQQSHLEKQKPIVTGKMLLKLGISSGPEMGMVIEAAYQAQLNGDITDEATAETWLNDHINSSSS